jgi:hypothetical protein
MTTMRGSQDALTATAELVDMGETSGISANSGVHYLHMLHYSGAVA